MIVDMEADSIEYVVNVISKIVFSFTGLVNQLPFSCFLRFLLLHILTVQTDRMIATMHSNIPPITAAVTACSEKIDN